MLPAYFIGVRLGLSCIIITQSSSLSLSYMHISRLRIVDNATPVVAVEGFADYTDVNAQDLVPWTPLKAGTCRM